MKLLITQSSPLPIPWSLLGPYAFFSTHILEVQVMKLLITQSSPLPIPWSLLGPYDFFSTRILDCLQPMSPLLM